MNEHNNIEAALKAGQAMAKPFEVEDVPAVLVPEGAKLETLEHLQELKHPRHIQKTQTVRSVDDFINYFNRFANIDSSIYAQIDNAKFTGVIDDNGATPAFGKHQVIYTCPQTDEWKAWQAQDKEWMSQERLAEFLEDNHLQIIKPSPEAFKPEELDVVHDKLPDAAHMLTIAASLEVSSNSSIKSAAKLTNGAVKIEYVEDVEGKAGANGELEIPAYFVIGVQLFKGGNGYLILCRFKYRKIGGEVMLRYELVRPHKTHEVAVQDVLRMIRDGKPNPDKEGEFLEGTAANTQHVYEVV